MYFLVHLLHINMYNLHLFLALHNRLNHMYWSRISIPLLASSQLRCSKLNIILFRPLKTFNVCSYQIVFMVKKLYFIRFIVEKKTPVISVCVLYGSNHSQLFQLFPRISNEQFKCLLLSSQLQHFDTYFSLSYLPDSYTHTHIPKHTQTFPYTSFLCSYSITTLHITELHYIL